VRKSLKRIGRPWARRHKGGWIITKGDLSDVLKNADAVEMGGITVGAKNLLQLVKLLPSEDCLVRSNGVRSNGRMEVETIEMVRGEKDGHAIMNYRKPPHNFTAFRLHDGAWLPKVRKPESVVVVIRPRKFT